MASVTSESPRKRRLGLRSQGSGGQPHATPGTPPRRQTLSDVLSDAEEEVDTVSTPPSTPKRRIRRPATLEQTPSRRRKITKGQTVRTIPRILFENMPAVETLPTPVTTTTTTTTTITTSRTVAMVHHCMHRIQRVVSLLERSLHKPSMRAEFRTWASNVLLVQALSYDNFVHTRTPRLRLPPSLHAPLVEAWYASVWHIARVWINHWEKVNAPLSEGLYALRRSNLATTTTTTSRTKRHKRTLVIPSELIDAAATEASTHVWKVRKQTAMLGAPHWTGLTQIVTHQWMVERIQGDTRQAKWDQSNAVLEYVLSTAFPMQPAWRKLDFRSTSRLKQLLRWSCEQRIYLYTHVALVISDWGGELNPTVSPAVLTELTQALAGWLRGLTCDPRVEMRNREVAAEVGCCLMILRARGCAMEFGEATGWTRALPSHLKFDKTDAVYDSVDGVLRRYHTMLCDVFTSRLAKWDKAKPGAASGTTFVQKRCNGVGALYVDYHMHYLIALFFTLFAREFPDHADA